MTEYAERVTHKQHRQQEDPPPPEPVHEDETELQADADETLRHIAEVLDEPTTDL